MPLCSEGSQLFLWNDKGSVYENIHIPFGCFIIRRSDLFHGGHGGSVGNLRLHMTLSHGTKVDSILHYPNEQTSEECINWAEKKNHVLMMKRLLEIRT